VVHSAMVCMSFFFLVKKRLSDWRLLLLSSLLLGVSEYVLREVGGRSGGSADFTDRRLELDGVIGPNRPDTDCLGVCWALLGNRPN
jgi:hypothetical protein